MIHSIIAKERDIYFPSTYLEPLESLQNYLGWDNGSDPKRLFALEKVENFGVSTITSLVLLENGKLGFVLYYPVFSNLQSSESEIDNQQKIFKGAVFGLYEVETWIEKAIENIDLEGIDFYLYNMAEDQLDSALNKPNVSATNYFVIAYQSNMKYLTQSSQIANLYHFDKDIVELR